MKVAKNGTKTRKGNKMAGKKKAESKKEPEVTKEPEMGPFMKFWSDGCTASVKSVTAGHILAHSHWYDTELIEDAKKYL